MRRRTAYAAVTLALGTLTLAGCTSATDGSSSGGAGIVAQDSAGGAQAAPAASSAPVNAPGSSTSRRASTTVPSEARIRTAELSITVPDRAAVAARADQAAALTERVGGEVESEDRGETYASLRLRVPPAALTSTLRSLSGYGKVTTQEVSSRDVTAQVADVSSRVRSAEQAIARLRALYTSAERVADVITVEQQLSTREADLESIQAQQRALTKQTALASIGLQLRSSAAAPPKDSDTRSGFLGGLERGWDAFTDVLTGAVTGLGAALPFLVLLAVAALPVRILVVRLRRRRPEPRPVAD